MLPHALVVAIRARCQNGVSIRLVIAKAKPNVAVISKPEVLVRRPIRIDSMKRDTERLNFSEQIPRPYNVSPAVMDLRKQVPPEGHASACPDRCNLRPSRKRRLPIQLLISIASSNAAIALIPNVQVFQRR
jgi:hypothetical protein